MNQCLGHCFKMVVLILLARSAFLATLAYRSHFCPVQYGVPKGFFLSPISLLSPMWFLLYLFPLCPILSPIKQISYRCHANDIQLYIYFNSWNQLKPGCQIIFFNWLRGDPEKSKIWCMNRRILIRLPSSRSNLCRWNKHYSVLDARMESSINIVIAPSKRVTEKSTSVALISSFAPQDH